MQLSDTDHKISFTKRSLRISVHLSSKPRHRCRRNDRRPNAYVLTLFLGSYALRTKNIHCVLRFRVFTVLERGSLIVINAFGVNSEDALGLVRFEKEEHPLRFSLLGVHV